VGEKEGRDAAADVDELSEDVILICSSAQQSYKHIQWHERAETEHRMGRTVSSTYQGAPSPGIMPLSMEVGFTGSTQDWKGLVPGWERCYRKGGWRWGFLRSGRVKRSGGFGPDVWVRLRI